MNPQLGRQQQQAPAAAAQQAPQPGQQPRPQQPTWFARNRNWVIPMIILIAIVFCLSCLVITGLVGYAFTRSAAAVPTAPYAPPASTEAPALPTPAAPANSSCPTTQEAKNLTGVDVQRLGTEPCAWVWRGVPPATTFARCPSGFACTWDVVNDITVVHSGVNQTAEIHAGTWRFVAAYPTSDAVHDICALYQKEKAFGLSEVPSFQVRFQSVTDGSLGPIGPQTCP